jgi:hypothetical protein
MALGGVVAVTLATAGAVAVVPPFDLADIPGSFYAAPLTAMGRAAVIVQLLATAVVVGMLESCLRGSRRAARWRTKYLLLGVGGILLAHIFFLSQVLLFNVLMGAYLSTWAVTLLIGSGLVGISMARGSQPGRDLAVSRHLVYRSIVIGVLGAYLVAVGVLSWLLALFDIPQKIFWSSLLIFVSAVALAAVLLSEDLRWKVKRFISRNFYRTKYDYRQEWSAFTNRFASVLTPHQLGPQLVHAVADTIGATRGALYLADPPDTRYRLAGVVEVEQDAPFLEPQGPLLAVLRGQRTPLLLESGAAPLHAVSRAFGEGSVAVPLRWHDALLGVMLLGPERTGAPYSSEDLDFLATVSEQAAGAIATAQLSERLAQAREFEAFHRLTSFVVHDLKNSTSALSMLAQNALANFDDPEFQRDAIQTLSSTVARMKALLAKLASGSEATARGPRPVDVAAVLREAIRPLTGNSRVTLDVELGQVPPVLGDADGLLRVFQNLLTNAAEAISGRGSVTVRLYEDHGWVVASVADTGCGMPPEFVQTALFVPLRSTKPGGWGIGLYQSKGVVEGHGGRIEVSSKEGEGSTLRVRLPAHSAAATMT